MGTIRRFEGGFLQFFSCPFPINALETRRGFSAESFFGFFVGITNTVTPFSDGFSVGYQVYGGWVEVDNLPSKRLLLGPRYRVSPALVPGGSEESGVTVNTVGAIC